ncbi:F0F1 ATP synthase subunit delta [Gandjariella thermophila]|uniref:ATP synthase subunit delta n=1 Tax=Gandjariella thermophila TaxID=1931992 RepID=A0A4D4JDH3_9PSEU|nr:F0F1 ATP synthase subunit delta [Gandjariella thermophila]GDY32446.1 ATP synthase subunit delta [Gandjariella thermophila]
MQFTSRLSLAVVRDRFEEQVGGTETGALHRLADQLSEAARVLDTERVLRRYLADPAAAESGRRGLAERVFGGKLDAAALDLLLEVVTQRWSRTTDLVDALESLARQALLASAERDGALDEVEDELFRFGRVLDSESRLRELLEDTSAPAPGRLDLLRGLLADKVKPVTLQLLEQAVRAPRHRSLDAVVQQLAELAASRRNRSMAQVVAAEPLSAEQEERLATVLSRIYGRPVSIQVEIDPEVIGGMVVRVGDEVIDGSIATRLARASRDLPR